MNYTTLDEDWRSTHNNLGAQSAKCDSTILPGWYRFMSYGENSRLPAFCPSPSNSQPRICGTHAPIWYNGKELFNYEHNACCYIGLTLFRFRPDNFPSFMIRRSGGSRL